MLSKAEIKNIKLLHDKKGRNETSCFIVEGPKVVSDFLKSNYKCKTVYATNTWIRIHKSQVPMNVDMVEITSSELNQISALSTCNEVLAVFGQMHFNNNLNKNLELVLDGINDPGNLGTIIRLAHWFGVQQITCSMNSVDCYNPKVVQASMGALAYVNVIYTNLAQHLQQCEQNKKPVYAFNINGKNLYETKIPKQAALLMGSESHGYSDELIPLIRETITIPSFNSNLQTDSLNVAIATAIACSHVMGIK